MSYPRKRHASMMESQKKAAEAAESLLAATGSIAKNSGETQQPAAVAAEAPKAAPAQASASIQHDDFADDSSDDSSDVGGIAFLQAGSSLAKKNKAAAKATPVNASSSSVGTRAAAAAATAAGGSSSAAPAGTINSLQRMHWTKEMDALLLHIVPIYDAKDWVSIAKHMGGDVTNEQCRNRWCCKVDPSLNTCKAGPWEPEEEAHMRELVQQYTNHPEQDKRGRRRYRDSIHWGAVARELNRSQKDCRSKWTTMQRSVVIQEMKKGPFTPEEDAIVMQRVAEWGDKGQGIWKALEQELGRPSNNIGNRYRKLVKSLAAAKDGPPVSTVGDDVTDYLDVDTERKLAIALAPAVAPATEPEPNLREAAIAAAAVLAGKKRGRPRTNPLPLTLDDIDELHTTSTRKSKRQRQVDELTEAMEGSAASVPVNGSSAATREPPAPGQPINASAELAAGRTKIGRSNFWNEERDALLVEAVQLYGKDWNKISAHVGEGANSDRCWQRWNRYLKPEAMVCKMDPWTTAELIKLEDLVLTHINNPHKRRAGRSTSRTTIDWTSISQLMGRPYMDCKGKWKKIRAFNMKKGPFTEEEDRHVINALGELGITIPDPSLPVADVAGLPAPPPIAYPPGFWEELSAALNRPVEILRARVRNLRIRAAWAGYNQ